MPRLDAPGVLHHVMRRGIERKKYLSAIQIVMILLELPELPERSFLGVLEKVVGNGYRIFAKVRLADIVEVSNPECGILIVWARNSDMAVILTSLVITGYFLIGAFLEERKMLAEFGEEYTGYQRRVSMLFPFKWVIKKLTGIGINL
ncbi:MAG TPA: DUF2726 domain-containing protein [Desulfobacterales bacterium]|nr:DUF2726 domain-containing protein [Desulfobacterales bacterium]